MSTEWLAYRKKPVVIHAYQTDCEIDIYTLEGVMRANKGDWVIEGIKGEHYPCKPDIFKATYELVDEEECDSWGGLICCPNCGVEYVEVRPGKQQAVCDCHERCRVHGAGKVVYHDINEFANVSGYFCAECWEG